MPLYRVLRFISFLLCKLFFHFEVFGKERIPRKGGFIIVSNHASFLDPVILGISCPRLLSYAARDSLFSGAFFADLLRRIGVFPIKRWSADLSAVRESARRLNGGFGLVIFPEGTRSASGDIQSVTRGFVLLAQKARVPIIPARIFGSHKAWPKSRRIFRPAKVRVLFLEPVYSQKDKDYNRTAREVFDRIKNSSIDKRGYL
ncbi:1-acyl-sn-glycerol-3-phosphate acyltransferase [bacterium]|nr:MAG: 1-acyl-sn-glycerol-3-phosphate acyltransferase [bacterium]